MRLNMLVRKHGGMANLCEALGYARKETAAMTRIANANLRHDRNGEPYVMGTPIARRIEKALGLENGWMDTPPTYAELHGDNDKITKAMALMESMPDDQRDVALRLLDALTKPPKRNGTEN